MDVTATDILKILIVIIEIIVGIVVVLEFLFIRKVNLVKRHGFYETIRRINSNKSTTYFLIRGETIIPVYTLLDMSYKEIKTWLEGLNKK
jgi:hypothetical protein